MDDAFKLVIDVFGWSTILYALFIHFVVLCFRRTAEAIKPSLTSNKTWRGLVLHSAPPVFGVLGAIVPANYPFPGVVASSMYARVMFGVVLGTLSGVVYKLLKSKFMPADDTKSKDDVPPVTIDKLRMRV